MAELKLIASPEELDSLKGPGDIPPLTAEELRVHRPDAHWVMIDNDGRLAGRCSLWWTVVPDLPGERLGVIGHYAARDAGSAGQLLAHACRELAGHGCTVAVGPMDGNSWRRYRFVTERGPEPPFFLEPDNPDDYPQHFDTAGFAPLARYYSYLVSSLEGTVTAAAGLEARLRADGITLRALRPDNFTGELERIYDLSLAGFRDNFLYTPIGRAEFLAMYAKVQPHALPELILFAEQEGSPVGFIFSLPDMLRLQRGSPLDTVILKSLAVLPAWSGRGIGTLLMLKAMETAREMGFRRAILALIHEQNRSRTMSGHYGEEMRLYTLYARRVR
ncbi:MAG TPA: GNAT family N-acetyltransferase [Geobacteraceae bacterium]